MDKCFNKLCLEQQSTYDLSSNEHLNLQTPLNELKIMGSYASYSSTGSYYSTSSIDQLKKNLCLQNRFIHLDIDFTVKEGKQIPIVKGEHEQNSNIFTFNECCKCINDYAWCTKTLNSYPIILFLNLKYDKIFINVSNRIANCLIKNFSDNEKNRWPDMKYNYGFKNDKDGNPGNLAKEPIENFLGKIIILTNYEDNTSKNNNSPRDNGRYLNELTHSYIKTYDNIIDIRDQDINFIRLNFNNKTFVSDKLSVNGKGNINDYLEQLKTKFIIAFPTYKNNKVNILKLFNLNIWNKELDRYNVVLKIFHPIENTESYKFKLLKSYIKFFTILHKMMPIRYLPKIQLE